MGAQIGLEYALGGHTVEVVTRSPQKSRDRARDAVEMLTREGLVDGEVLGDLSTRISYRPDPPTDGGPALVVESLPEDLDLKVAVLRELGAPETGAIIASNTSSLSVTALGAALGAPERTVGTHYWNPPLLMPLVELVSGDATAESTVRAVEGLLLGLGKSPVRVDRDVPGFVWNRLQLALLREAVWLADNHVADPATIDEIVRRGLARRWTLTGPFETARLGGVEVFQRIAENLLPILSDARSTPTLSRWVEELGPADPSLLVEARDRGLATYLRAERKD